MLSQNFFSFYLIVTLIVLSGLFYLVILFLKNIVSRKNLKRAVGVDVGYYSMPGNSSDSVQYCYLKKSIDRGPDIAYFIMCIGMLRNSASFIVVRERIFDKIFKMFGISSELQTGYEWFDKRYYIVSETNKKMPEHLLVTEQTCKIIKKLLAEGFDYIKLEEGIIKVGFSTFTGWRWFRPGVIERSATLLTELREHLEKQIPEKKRTKRVSSFLPCGNIESFVQFYIKIPDKLLKHYPKKWVRQRKLWLLSAGYVFLTGIFCMAITVFFDPYPVVEFKQVFFHGVLYLVFPVMLLHLLAAGVHLSGRARSHKELSWIAAANGIGYTFIAMLVFPVLNGVFDDSPVMFHSVKLLDTDYYHSSKGPDRYYITVESWRNSDTEKLQVSQSVYNLSAARINKKVTILTKAGAFNVEWLYGYIFRKR